VPAVLFTSVARARNPIRLSVVTAKTPTSLEPRFVRTNRHAIATRTAEPRFISVQALSSSDLCGLSFPGKFNMSHNCHSFVIFLLTNNHWAVMIPTPWISERSRSCSNKAGSGQGAVAVPERCYVIQTTTVPCYSQRS